MKSADLNLDRLRTSADKSLRIHLDLLDTRLGFKEFRDFSLTPEKPNSARAVIPITYDGRDTGDMYVIAFLPRDGTGDAKTYELTDVTIPLGLRHNGKPEKVIPRAKTGIITEGFFPLFSMNAQGQTVPFAAHLDELTLGNDNRIYSAWKLGQDRADYMQSVNSGRGPEPQVYFTVGSDGVGQRFGDPHAIYHGLKTPSLAQVVGFLSVKDADSPLLDITDKWAIPSR